MKSNKNILLAISMILITSPLYLIGAQEIKEEQHKKQFAEAMKMLRPHLKAQKTSQEDVLAEKMQTFRNKHNEYTSMRQKADRLYDKYRAQLQEARDQETIKQLQENIAYQKGEYRRYTRLLNKLYEDFDRFHQELKALELSKKELTPEELY